MGFVLGKHFGISVHSYVTQGTFQSTILPFYPPTDMFILSGIFSALFVCVVLYFLRKKYQRVCVRALISIALIYLVVFLSYWKYIGNFAWETIGTILDLVFDTEALFFGLAIIVLVLSCYLVFSYENRHDCW
jgi:predicted branched-subunit amino acid permease